MARDINLVKREYAAIRSEYNRLKGLKALGKTKFSEDYIIASIAEKFFKRAATIESIVYYRTKI